MPKKKTTENNKGEIIIYKLEGEEVKLEVKLGGESVWLTQAGIAALFGIMRPAITKHLRNIFKTGELDRKSVSSILEHTALDGKKYKTQFYNLDAIISVGYRINSRKATQFRIWATKVLKNHLVKGYTINEKMLFEAHEKFDNLRKTIFFLNSKSQEKAFDGQEKEILSLLSDYSKTLTVLEQYDKKELKALRGKKDHFRLDYATCLDIIAELKNELIKKGEASNFFGVENNVSLKGIISNIYQTFDRKELYAGTAVKAAHILYLVIKDHPFVDGNKRIGAFFLVYFLDKTGYLFRETGERKINDNALAALALLVAESNAREKDQIIALVTQLLK